MLSVEPLPAVDVKLPLESVGRRPVVVYRPVHEHIVVDCSGLGDGLHAGHVGVERADRPPQRVVPVELACRVECPAGPSGVDGRIARAMVVDVVDAGQE